MPSVRFIKTTDNSLTITKTTELDSKKYTCVASTRLDEATADATLLVEDVPNAPTLVRVTCRSVTPSRGSVVSVGLGLLLRCQLRLWRI